MRQMTHSQEDLKIVCEVVLAMAFMFTAVGAWFWLNDPRTFIVSFIESFFNHPIFTMAAISLVFLFVYGIHKLVIAPQIITSRMRSVLSDYNMSCDDTGRLILKPRPSSHK